MFGHEVKLTYKGDSRFKTLFGGLMSLACMALVLAYVISELKRVVDHTVTIEQTTLYYDRKPDLEFYKIEASLDDFIV